MLPATTVKRYVLLCVSWGCLGKAELKKTLKRKEKSYLNDIIIPNFGIGKCFLHIYGKCAITFAFMFIVSYGMMECECLCPKSPACCDFSLTRNNFS